MVAAAVAAVPGELVSQMNSDNNISKDLVPIASEKDILLNQQQIFSDDAFSLEELIAALSLATALWIGSVYNSLNKAKTTVDSRWAQVENQMQRRADLIPQLTQVAESYVGRETQIVENLSAARATFLSAATVAEQNVADQKMKGAIANFQSFSANNQQLQASQLFVNLQYEIAGSENRIATERMRYNQAVENYNRSVEGFPTVVVAGMLGFETQPFLGRK
ncbi:LemA family protein [Leptolyngbya sp. BC1307]|uniref:LemA family protein n=1 Tax=Leptolyngbya sp. BC1307 TaxID=2029589 RepID=UPI001483733A|nr:LemA family protein [Leptolyngbya sp. BC1307]